MISAISAVSALLTVTSTTPASRKDRRIFRQRQRVRRDRAGRSPSKLVSRRPLASISAITRGRASNATWRPAAASMPPTKQPMLPAPAMPIGLSAIHSAIPSVAPTFDSRLSRSVPIERATRRKRALCRAL